MYIAIDIGGTNTRIGIFKKNKIEEIIKFKTKINDFDLEVKEIAETINKYKDIQGIGVSAPGPADFKKGIFGETPNLKEWAGKNFKKSLEKQTRIKNIVMENDANLMGLAHHNYFKNFGKITLFFTISTGLGAGLIINDEIFRGAHGRAMEVANAPVSWLKESGKNLTEGSLELFASGSGISYRSKKDARDVFKSKNSRDIKIIDDAIETLANMISTSVLIINPNLVVFDGSVARNNTEFVQKAWNISKKRSSKNSFNKVKMEISKLGDDAGLYGAYQLISKNKK